MMSKHSLLKRHAANQGWNGLDEHWCLDSRIRSRCSKWLLETLWVSTTRTPAMQDSKDYPAFSGSGVLQVQVSYAFPAHLQGQVLLKFSLKTIERAFFHIINLIFIERSRHLVCGKCKLKRSHKHEGRKTKRKYIDWGVKQTPHSTGIYGKDMEPTYLYERWWKEASHKDLELAHLWQRLLMQKWVVLQQWKKM